MNQDTLDRANEINEDVKVLRDNVHFFAPMDKRNVSKYDENATERAKMRKRQFSFLGFMRDGKKKAKLNFNGFFGGKEIEVDNDFVIMCHNYFLEKLEEKKKELEQLN